MENVTRFLKALTVMFVGLCFCFIPTLVEASCPSSVPDNSGTGWTPGTPCFIMTLNLDGSDCQFNVCWCYRLVTGTQYFDYVITSIIKVDGTCGTTNINYYTVEQLYSLITQALHKLIIVDPAYAVYSSSIPACGSGYAKLLRREIKANCWEVQSPSGGNGGAIYVCAGTGWCIVEDSVCMGSDGYPQTTGTNSYTYTGTCLCNNTGCN